eukprot:c10009_g4_i1.p1 GENE.c10009_g4_i1~~c10009_g4_i1.p1  ORF type:complete len:191 (+),score=49.51 c10009_g4_i1:477-1049(+)
MFTHSIISECTIKSLAFIFFICSRTGNEIGEIGARDIATAIESGKCKLARLWLSDNDIGDKGAYHMASAIANEKCSLIYLSLKNNKISSAGAHHIATAVESGYRSLTELDLSGNLMSFWVCHSISRAIYANESVRDVLIECAVEASSDELHALLSLAVNCRWTDTVKMMLCALVEVEKLHNDTIDDPTAV